MPHSDPDPVLGNRANGSPLVLVVEDEALVRLYAVDVLEEAGFRVVEAANADEALDHLSARPDVDLLLTDVDMPGRLNGFALARTARARRPDLPVVVVSGKMHPEPGDLPPGGAFIGKPYRPATIVRQIRSLLTSAA